MDIITEMPCLFDWRHFIVNILNQDDMALLSYLGLYKNHPSHSFNWPDPFKKEVLQSKLKIPFTLKKIGNKDGIYIEWVMLFKKEYK